ncbi:hypothetical protein [Shimia thalassica]
MLETENAKLKKLLAGQLMDNDMLGDVNSKKDDARHQMEGVGGSG